MHLKINLSIVQEQWITLMEYNIKNSSNIEQLYISLRMSVWLSFYWLGDNEIENQINKVSFQNSQTERTFIVIESRINLISFVGFMYTPSRLYIIEWVTIWDNPDELHVFIIVANFVWTLTHNVRIKYGNL